MREREAGLIVRVRQGVLSFERLVEVFATEGYLTDADGADGLEFSRVCIDATHQEDFIRCGISFIQMQGMTAN